VEVSIRVGGHSRPMPRFFIYYLCSFSKLIPSCVVYDQSDSIMLIRK